MLQGLHDAQREAEPSQRRQVRDDGAATMLQGSVRRRNAKQELSRDARFDHAVTMLRGSVRRRNAKRAATAPKARRRRGHDAPARYDDATPTRAVATTLSSGRWRGDDAAAWYDDARSRGSAAAQGPRRRRGHDAPGLAGTQRQASLEDANAATTARPRCSRARYDAATPNKSLATAPRADDGAATMLQGSYTTRNAKQEVQQRRKVRDDGAATMLQGSVRRCNAKRRSARRLSGRRPPRCSVARCGAATPSKSCATAPGSGRQGSHDAPGLGTKTQRQGRDVERRRRQDEADDAALRAAFGSPSTASTTTATTS